MRLPSAPAASCLSGLLLSGLLLAPAPAGAAPASGWVDPPAKTGDAKTGDVKTGEKAEAPRESEPEASEPATAASAARRAPRLAEHRRRRAARREAHRPMAAPSESGTASDPRFAGWAGQAQRLADDYLDSVSSGNDAMLASAPRFYGERVRFHGRDMSLAALIAEKRRFVRRWPARRYQPQDGATHTACSAASATCIVRTVFGFQAENPARGARSQGLSELVLTVSFAGERPVIVSETSRVLRRGGLALGSAGHGGGV